jgi:penicillin-binding protein 1A
MNRPVAGKTGTTSFDVDAWFCGYTANLVGVVWMGFDKEEAMSGVYGGTVCGPIWKDVMTIAHKDIPVTNFPKPDGIVDIQVDYKSGLLPSPLTPEEFLVTEKFNSAYVPTEISNVWFQLPVCADTGKLLTDFCPSSVTGTFLQRPVPWSGEQIPLDAELEPPHEYCPIHGGVPFSSSGIRLQGYPILTHQSKLDTVQLNWTHPSLSAETVFQVYRSSFPNIVLNEANHIADIAIGKTNWKDNTVEENTRYYYVITASDPQSEETNLSSNEISVYTGTSPQQDRLSAPRLNGSAYINGHTVTVNLIWTKASDTKEPVYYIFRSEDPNFELSPANQIALQNTIKGTSWTDTGLSTDKNYYYRIIAIDPETKEQSAPSNQIKVFLPKKE